MTQMLFTKNRMVISLMPKAKHLIEWVMSHNGWSQGNNLQENELTVSFVDNKLNATTICKNGLGSVFSTERYLNVVCPECFIHLFKTKNVLVFDI